VANLPVPTPRTFAVSETETAAYLNSLRDALLFLLNPPEAVVYGAAVQSIPNNTQTALACDTTQFDSYGMHSNSTNNTRCTAQVAGTYLAICTYASAGVLGGGRNVQPAKNGVLIPYAAGQYDASIANFHVVQAKALITMAVGDYVEAWALQNSGGALNTNANGSSLQVLWVHA
jgi:hypothetical protein